MLFGHLVFSNMQLVIDNTQLTINNCLLADGNGKWHFVIGLTKELFGFWT